MLPHYPEIDVLVYYSLLSLHRSASHHLKGRPSYEAPHQEWDCFRERLSAKLMHHHTALADVEEFRGLAKEQDYFHSSDHETLLSVTQTQHCQACLSQYSWLNDPPTLRNFGPK